MIIRILGIDPGSINCGFSVIDVNIETKMSTVIYSQTLKEPEMYRLSRIDKNLYTPRFIRYAGVRVHFRDVLEMFQPNAVACESPFFQPRREQTFRVLSELTSMFQLDLFETHPGIRFDLFPPRTVKSFVKMRSKKKGEEEKDVVREALMAFPLVQYAPDINIDDLDEHEIDSICIALCKTSSIF